MLHVAPPNDHVGGIERGFIDALFRRFEVRGFYDDAGLFREVRGDGFAEELLAVSLLLRGLLFVPNEDADIASRGECGGE